MNYTEKLSLKLVLIPIFLLGTVAGLSAGYLSSAGESEESFCKDLEQDIMNEVEFGQNAACYSPGHIAVTEEDIDEAELDCVCRIIYEGEVELYPIYRASQFERSLN